MVSVCYILQVECASTYLSSTWKPLSCCKPQQSLLECTLSIVTPIAIRLPTCLWTHGFTESYGKAYIYLHRATVSFSGCGPEPEMHEASVPSDFKIRWYTTNSSTEFRAGPPSLFRNLIAFAPLCCFVLHKPSEPNQTRILCKNLPSWSFNLQISHMSSIKILLIFLLVIQASLHCSFIETGPLRLQSNIHS